MKKFLLKLFLFLGAPILLISSLETFILPPNFFTYRSWEALLFLRNLRITGPFYPDFTIRFKEEGDLAHHTKDAILKNNLWVTDEYGFRNSQFIRDPDIIYIGDSFVAGVGLSQEQTITSQLQQRLSPKLKVLNMAPFTFSNFVDVYQRGILKKPKLIIYSRVEWITPELLSLPLAPKSFLGRLKQILMTGNVNVTLDRLSRFFFIEWAKARLKNAKGKGYPSPFDPHMKFYRGAMATTHSDTETLEAAKAIQSFKAYCDSQGIDFMYVPMPNKETVYYELVPFKNQPSFLLHLDTLLKEKKIVSINTVELYNKERKLSKKLLYYPDDTHWNPHAVAIVADEIVKQISLLKK